MSTSKSRTRQVILGFLSWGPRSGYDIKQAVDGSISHFWSESFGQIYPTLRTLEKEGLVERVGDEQERRRQPFAITTAGRGLLDEWLAQPPVPSRPRSELLLKLFFAGQAEPADTRAHVLRHRERTREQHERLEAIERSLPLERAGHPHLPYWLLTLRLGISEARANLTWCDEALAVLAEMDHGPQGTGGA